MLALERLQQELYTKRQELVDVVMRGAASHEDYIKITAMHATLGDVAERIDDFLIGEEND
jgi:hypothetical protein